MANHEHLAILKQGVEQWNKWRDEYSDTHPDLSDADLRQMSLHGADLDGADLKRARLTGADLIGSKLNDAELGGANLCGTDLYGASLVGANLGWADLRQANLGWANLGGANLEWADLKWANLTGADLIGADFAEASAEGTIFANVNLSVVRGLESIRHAGPSYVSIDTLYKSKGRIPEGFLRGCGVPDEFIAYIRSMVGRPIEFYSCFISYSSNDQAFADRLYADLQAKGVRCWFAPHDIVGGRKIHEQLDEAIRLHDKLLLILSEHSMASDWVGTEIADAREREAREKKQLLFPITIAPFEDVKRWKLFDADRGKDSAREIREYFIPDFSNWKEHDSYQAALEGLVKGLKAG